MNTVQLSEAKAQLSALVASAERGEASIITRNGKPAAMIVPIDADQTSEPQTPKTFAELLLSMPVDMDFERDPSPGRDIDL